MKKFNLKLYDYEDDSLITEFQSTEVPFVNDEIKITKNDILYIEHRVFSVENPTEVELYGFVDKLEDSRKANPIREIFEKQTEN